MIRSNDDRKSSIRSEHDSKNELEQFRKDDYFNRQLKKLIDTISYPQYEKNISAKIVKDMDEEDAEEVVSAR